MELAATLPDVIHLEVGEPSFDTPQHIVEAAVQAARDGFTKYTPNAGVTSLRQALVEKLRTDNRIDAALANVVVTNGGVGALTSAILATVDVGDEVLLPDPGWPNYNSATLIVGATPRKYPLDPGKGFLPDLATLEEMVTERTKLILVNSPCNPTGAVFSRDIVQGLAEFCQKHDLYMLSDEVYEHIIFEGEHVSPSLFAPERVISVFSFSKTYAMTGWRVGYVYAPKEVATVMVKLQEPLTSCVNGIAQKAAEAALAGPQHCVEEMCASYKKRRDIAAAVLRSHDLLNYTPHGAFYILVNIAATGMESYAFSKALIREEHVAVAPGGTFGEIGRSFVRVSTATAEDQLREELEGGAGDATASALPCWATGHGPETEDVRSVQRNERPAPRRDRRCPIEETNA